MNASQRLAAALDRLNGRINWEHRDRRAGMRVSLDPARDLVRLMGDPQKQLPCVHVTGSKGKGSVCALVAAGLRAAGWMVGRYGSPHVERLHERIELDGHPIRDEPLAEALERVLASRQEAEEAGTPAGDASWFDLVTAAGLYAFEREGVDWSVLEVGLGGRLDSTNVVQAEVCVVTSIGLEHTAVLGSTREAIAGEKAGILKPGSSFVCGVLPTGAGDDPGRVLAERARELDIEPVWVPSAGAGPIAERNRALAAAVLDELALRGHRSPRDESPLGGELLTPERCQAARLPGRMEWRRAGSVPVLLDGAHTGESVRQVLHEAIDLRGRPAAVVLSLARDKQLDAILKAMLGAVDSLVCTSLASGLHHSAHELCGRALELGLPAEAVSDPKEALQRAIASAPRDGWVLVSGSLYLVGELRDSLGPLETPA